MSWRLKNISSKDLGRQIIQHHISKKQINQLSFSFFPVVNNYGLYIKQTTFSLRWSLCFKAIKKAVQFLTTRKPAPENSEAKLNQATHWHE